MWIRYISYENIDKQWPYDTLEMIFGQNMKTDQ